MITKQTREVGREVLARCGTVGGAGKRAACKAGEAEKGKRTAVASGTAQHSTVQYSRERVFGSAEGSKRVYRSQTISVM